MLVRQAAKDGRIPVKWDIKKHPVFEVGLEHTYTAAAGRKGRESHGLEEQKKGVRRKAGMMAALISNTL